jgi:hypothetical protein
MGVAGVRVVMPFTHLRPEVVDALAGWGVELRDVSGSDSAYWSLLDEMWRDGQTFCIVEHDVVVGPQTLFDLEACEHDWCSCQVPYVGLITAGLSCAKFSVPLIARHPEALEQIALLEDEKHPPKHWCMLDSWLRVVLEGEAMHVHEPPLEHLRDEAGYWAISPAHGCHP